MNKIAVISLSGGMDSTSLLLHLINNKYTVYALSFNYRQKHKLEINKVDFNFNRCENNINLFKKELHKDEIEYIEKKLKKYLYPL